MISEYRLLQLQTMLEEGTASRFYDWPEWARARDLALATDHHECQICRSRGRYHAAVLVHHVKHLKDRPDLALSVFDEATGERQLLSVCRPCHEALHPERMRRREFIPAPPVTQERWD